MTPTFQNREVKKSAVYPVADGKEINENNFKMRMINDTRSFTSKHL